MEITVEGRGSKKIIPNLVNFNFNFITTSTTYETVLEEGTKNVLNFINEFLIQNGFATDDLKTSSFSIREEKFFNDETKMLDTVGYIFNQSATLEFDYNVKKLATLIENIAKLSLPPTYIVKFGIKDIVKIKRTLLDEAFKDAKEQASIIASISDKSLKDCTQVSTISNQTSYFSNSVLESSLFIERNGIVGNIINTFVPEDIEIIQVLHCKWITN